MHALTFKEKLQILLEQLQENGDPATTRLVLMELLKESVGPIDIVCEDCEDKTVKNKRTLNLPHWCPNCEEMTYSKLIPKKQ